MGLAHRRLLAGATPVMVFGQVASMALVLGSIVAALGACVGVIQAPGVVAGQPSASPAPEMPAEVRLVIGRAFAYRYTGGEVFFVRRYTMQELVDAGVLHSPPDAASLLDTQHWVVVCRNLPGQPELQTRYLLDQERLEVWGYGEARGGSLLIGPHASAVPAELLRTYRAAVPSVAPTMGSTTPSPG